MQARSLPARTGVAWLKAAFALYRRNPPLLTSVTMIYLMIVVGLNFIPLLGSFIVPLLLPMLNLIIGNTCRLIASSQQPNGEQMMSGIKEQRPMLLRLGAMQLGASILLLLVMMLLEGGSMPEPGAKPDMEDVAGMLLRLFLLAAPLLLAFWFAPLLTGWAKVPAGKAVFFSLVACWRNLGAFCVYLLSIVVVAILLPGLVMALATMVMPDLLGGLSFVLRTVLIVVLTPILMAGAYVSYRDVFHISEQAD
jgi:hypothetical protein